MAVIMTILNLAIENNTFPQFTQDVNAILLIRYFGSWLQVFFIYVFIYHLFVYYQKSSLAEKARINAELHTLRSQINPHFYFNTLNNLYGLALENSPKTQEAILKLSSIMEYIIYDCRSLEVSLMREIKFIESYIELERLRYEENRIVEFINNTSQTNLQIAPMLLIPFVENAFKHGSESSEGMGSILIKVYVENNRFFFEVKNKCNTDIKEGGVGLENVQKRLILLYPQRHSLSLNNSNCEFEVKLLIIL
jgi:LytS/YehU family sensor histidine kinase